MRRERRGGLRSGPARGNPRMAGMASQREERRPERIAEPRRPASSGIYGPINHFLIQFGIIGFNPGSNEIYIQDNKYFLLSPEIAAIIKNTKKPFYAGAYLGRARGTKFFPSVLLLERAKENTKHKVWLDEKTSWLFVCGRDVFSEGIKGSTRQVKQGIITFILNEQNELLGFGKVMKPLSDKGAVIENIFDIGDFLRREKKR